MESCGRHEGTVQKRITDYFLVQPVPTPTWLKRMCADARVISKRKCPEHSFATIVDLPNELLLLILDFIRANDRVYHNHARKLAMVCKRFHQVFASLALKNVYCNGSMSTAKFEAFLFGHVSFPPEAIKRVTFAIEEPEKVWLVSKRSLVHLILGLSGLTTITIIGVSVNLDHMIALGKLSNLTSLTYDHSIMFPTTAFIGFSIQDLEKSKHLFPSRLKAVSFTLSTHQYQPTALALLLSVLSASADSLDSLVVNIQVILRSASLKDLFKMDFPVISNLVVYSYNTQWSNFHNFCTRHYPHLQKVEYLLHLVCDADIPQVNDIPGLESSPFAIPALAFAVLMRTQVPEIGILKFSEDPPTPSLVVEELTIQRGHWMMLDIIARDHSSIKILNAWDLLGEYDEVGFDPVTSPLPIDDLIVASPYLQNLEVLRFNTDERGLSNVPNPKPFPFCHVCCASNCICNPLDHAHCKHRLSKDIDGIDDAAQRVLQWEEGERALYNRIIHELLNWLPSLRLVEWFLVPYALAKTTTGMFAPYWSWEIQWKAAGEPNVFGTLHDTNLQPLDHPPILSLTRGFSLQSNHS